MDEALRLEVALESEGNQAFTISEYGRLLAMEGDVETGLEYIGLARSHPHVEHFGRAHFSRLVEEVRGDLSDQDVEGALARGAELKLEQVIADLLGQVEPA